MKISVDRKQLKQANTFLQFSKKNIPKAVKLALNATGYKIKTRANKKVREIYNVRAGDVRGKIKPKLATIKDLSYQFGVKDNNIPLARFKITSSKRFGTRASVKKGDKKTIPGAFRYDFGQYNTGPRIFRRKGKERRAKFKQLYGPGVPIMLNEPGIVEELEEYGRTEMNKIVNQKVDYVLGQFKSK